MKLRHAPRGISGRAATRRGRTPSRSEPQRRLLAAGAFTAVAVLTATFAVTGVAQAAAGVSSARASSAGAQSDRAVPGDIYEIDGMATNNGLSGPARQAAIGTPDGVLVKNGNIYVADGPGNRVLEIAGADQTQWGIQMTKGDVYVIAGSATGQPGSSGNGTPAVYSRLFDPVGVAMDDQGDLFIADFGSGAVMELTASATPWGDMRHPVADALYRVAGTGANGSTGPDGEPATSSALDEPAAVFIGGSAGGNLYIADSLNNRIQMVPQVSGPKWGRYMTAYDAYTVAGSPAGLVGSGPSGQRATSGGLDEPQDVIVDNVGDLLIADTLNCRVEEVAKTSGVQWGSMAMTAGDIYTVAGRSGLCTGGANGKAAIHSDLNFPEGLADPAGNLFIADSYNNQVKVVAGSTGTRYGQPMTAGDVYAVAGTGAAGSSGDGGPADSAQLNDPADVAVTRSGDVFIADAGNAVLRKVSDVAPFDITGTAGNGFTLANTGDGGPALGSGLANPDGEVTDAEGNLYIADGLNNRVQEVAATNHTQFGIQMTAGDTYTIAGSATGAAGTSGNGVPATSALMIVPTSVAVDGSGDLYIDDCDNNRVVEVAATSHTQFGIRMTAGDSYTVAGSVTGAPGNAGDGGPATSAQLFLPSGIAVDAAGNLFIADTVNNRIQEVPVTSGTQFGIPMKAGYMYTIAGSATGNHGTSGDGGPGPSALLANPFGVGLDGAGNVYIADTANNRIQELAAASGVQWGRPMKAGDIYTIAGSPAGRYGNSGDGGPAARATLYDPADVAVTSSGSYFIADAFNSQIREVPAASGKQYGQSMTAGDIYTVAGAADGLVGVTDPGIPATRTVLYLPIDVGTDAAGDLFIPDLYDESMLEVTAASDSPFPVYPQVSGVAAQPANAEAGAGDLRSGGGCLAGLASEQRGRVLRAEAVLGRHLTSGILKIFATLGVNAQAGACLPA